MGNRKASSSSFYFFFLLGFQSETGRLIIENTLMQASFSSVFTAEGWWSCWWEWGGGGAGADGRSVSQV